MRPIRFSWSLFLGSAGCLFVAVFLCTAILGTGFQAGHGAVILAGATAMALLQSGITRRFAARFAEVIKVAASYSRGGLSARVNLDGADELALLARLINEMRDHLDHQLSTIDRQRLTLSSLVTQLQEGVIVSGPDGRIVLVNPEAVRLLRLISPRPDGSFEGLMVERCVAQHDLQELLRPEASASTSPTEWSGTLDAEASGTAVRPRIAEAGLQMEMADGTISLLARACDLVLPVDSGVQRPSPDVWTGRLLVLTDVTELARTIQIKTDFAANASHELRTPLAAILAAAETLQSLDGIPEPAAAKRLLGVIERKGRQMQAMVADLMDLSRLESPTARFDAERVSVLDLVEELHSAFESPLTEKNLNWRAEVSTVCQELVVHSDLLRIVLKNLIENAVRFTPAGGHVSLSFRPEADGVVIEVADDGCGIPEEELPRVFERFYQVSRSRSGTDRGTGLGLSIVRHAVAALGGTIDLKSQVGAGTQVTVRIARHDRSST